MLTVKSKASEKGTIQKGFEISCLGETGAVMILDPVLTNCCRAVPPCQDRVSAVPSEPI